MNERQVVNAGAGVLTVYGLVGLAIKIISAMQFAQGLPDVAAVWNNPNLNWSGIYLLCFLLGGAVLLVRNWDVWRRWWNMRRANQLRTWDMPLEFAVDYIAFDSLLALTLREGEEIESAAAALIEKLRCGEVHVAGRTQASMSLTPIPAPIVQDLWLGYSIENPRHDPKTFNARMMWAQDRSCLVYEGLFVDKAEVQGVWLPKPKSRRLYG